MAENILTQYRIKTNGKYIMKEALPYLTAWNVNALKYYTILLTENSDREAVIQINNLYCDFNDTIEFIGGINL
jgi:hypothetical protein